MSLLPSLMDLVRIQIATNPHPPTTAIGIYLLQQSILEV